MQHAQFLIPFFKYIYMHHSNIQELIIFMEYRLLLPTYQTLCALNGMQHFCILLTLSKLSLSAIPSTYHNHLYKSTPEQKHCNHSVHRYDDMIFRKPLWLHRDKR